MRCWNLNPAQPSNVVPGRRVRAPDGHPDRRVAAERDGDVSLLLLSPTRRQLNEQHRHPEEPPTPRPAARHRRRHRGHQPAPPSRPPPSPPPSQPPPSFRPCPPWPPRAAAQATPEPGQTVALVTGSTSGLGRELALRLGARGDHVIVHGRSVERGAEVVDSINAAGPGSARFYRADLASFAEVRTFRRKPCSPTTTGSTS